jgi:hypothetical protein
MGSSLQVKDVTCEEVDAHHLPEKENNAKIERTASGRTRIWNRTRRAAGGLNFKFTCTGT